MKKQFTLIFIIILACSTGTKAQDQNVSGILIKCISLPELQKFMSEGSPVYVLQHGVSFPTGTDVSKSVRKVVFLNKTQLESENIKSYFLFWEFKIEINSAKIDYVFNYPGTDGNTAIQRVILRLHKDGETWNVVETQIVEG